MKISVELSLYPLQDDYVPNILAFIESLNGYEGLKVNTNALSTQVHGDYDLVMRAITESLKKEFESGVPQSLVCKILNLDRAESRWNQ